MGARTRTRSSEGEGAGISRVVEDLQRSRMSQGAPDDLALVRATPEATRKEQFLAVEDADRGEG